MVNVTITDEAPSNSNMRHSSYSSELSTYSNGWRTGRMFPGQSLCVAISKETFESGREIIASCSELAPMLKLCEFGKSAIAAAFTTEEKK